jgi:type II secretory pathway pseudopilin PulG
VKTLRRATPGARAARAFTLLEVMIVITVIITLMSLVLGVGSALLRNAEKSQVESAMQIIESGLNEFEAQMGRQMTFNGAYGTGETTEVFPTGAVDAVFDIRNPGTAPAPANNTGDRIWVNRARGIGVFAVNLLRQYDSIRTILGPVPQSLLRAEPNASQYPGVNIGGTGSGLYLPSARASGGGSASTRSEFVDTWGNRIAFVFPGRAFRPLVDGGLPDPDGSVRTPYERVFGVCSNRRICMVSAGPDGLFGVAGESPEMTGTTAAAAAARAAAAGDNIYLYPLDPPS